jgi:hypothetical protein
MKTENPSRWVNNGLPRKGWQVITCVCLDPADAPTSCQWCGTELRHVFYLNHPDTGDQSIAGCVCTEHLTQDYVNPKQYLKTEKARVRRAKTAHRKFFSVWSVNSRGSHTLFFKGAMTTIFFHRVGWKWVREGRFSEREYPTVDGAKLAAKLACWQTLDLEN